MTLPDQRKAPQGNLILFIWFAASIVSIFKKIIGKKTIIHIEQMKVGEKRPVFKGDEIDLGSGTKVVFGTYLSGIKYVERVG